MPKEMEAKLKKQASKLASAGKLKKIKGRTEEEAKNAYIFGTLRKTGWKPSTQK